MKYTPDQVGAQILLDVDIRLRIIATRCHGGTSSSENAMHANVRMKLAPQSGRYLPWHGSCD